jgi:hypothetical protein
MVHHLQECLKHFIHLLIQTVSVVSRPDSNTVTPSIQTWHKRDGQVHTMALPIYSSAQRKGVLDELILLVYTKLPPGKMTICSHGIWIWLHNAYMYMYITLNSNCWWNILPNVGVTRGHWLNISPMLSANNRFFSETPLCVNKWYRVPSRILPSLGAMLKP